MSQPLNRLYHVSLSSADCPIDFVQLYYILQWTLYTIYYTTIYISDKKAKPLAFYTILKWCFVLMTFIPAFVEMVLECIYKWRHKNICWKVISHVHYSLGERFASHELRSLCYFVFMCLQCWLFLLFERAYLLVYS